jgi:GTP-binding protein HflX
VVWDAMPFLLSDTVGFIRKLPHHLIESFKSTLDEVRESDILVHVVDIAHPQHEDHIRTVQNTLNELGAADRTTLMVFNKVDLYRQLYFDDFLDQGTKEEIMQEIQQKFSHLYPYPNVLISATEKENIEQLRDVLREMIAREYTVRYPYQTKSW